MSRSVRTFLFDRVQSRPRFASANQRVAGARASLVGRIGLVALGVLVGLCALATTGLAQEAESAEISEAYHKAMRAYLESQGSHSQFGQGVAYQVANETLMMIASTGAQVTEEMQTIVLEEALSTYSEKFSDVEFLTTIWAPVYAKHFSVDELNAMTTWFQSELGSKVVALTQALNEEGMGEIQKASIAISPEFQLAVDARLREAGFVPNTELQP